MSDKADMPTADSAHSYVREPAEIYRRSFEIVSSEADLAALPQEMRPVLTRMIHACGMVDIVKDVAFSKNAAAAGQAALAQGSAIYCDVEMVRNGIIQSRLPADNAVRCTLNDPRVVEHAKTIHNTRSAAAVDFWDDLDGSVVVIGNAPTALFRLLERVAEGAGKPALVIGIPVGFVGAVESKEALADFASPALEFITLHGRRGGSAIASSVVNALCGGLS